MRKPCKPRRSLTVDTRAILVVAVDHLPSAGGTGAC
jgi:hypothetical protein